MPANAPPYSINKKGKRPSSSLDQVRGHFTEIQDIRLVEKYYGKRKKLAPDKLLLKTMKKLANPAYPVKKNRWIYQCALNHCKSTIPRTLTPAKDHARLHFGNLPFVCELW